MPSQNCFGGDWTLLKLDILRDYLNAYSVALKKRHFKKIYIDAFAGCGSVTLPDKCACKSSTESFLPEDSREVDTSNKPHDGSARLALQTEGFDEYIFIEQEDIHIQSLKRLAEEFPRAKGKIKIIHGEANEELIRICKSMDPYTRGVVFLDPYGLSVKWSTLEAIAQTKKLDMWYLFATNDLTRNLPNDLDRFVEDNLRRICEAMGIKPEMELLTETIYGASPQANIFGDDGQKRTIKTSQLPYLIKKRLETLFGEIPDPPPLKNSKNGILFHLFFAVSNPSPKAKQLALKVHKYILEKRV